MRLRLAVLANGDILDTGPVFRSPREGMLRTRKTGRDAQDEVVGAPGS